MVLDLAIFLGNLGCHMAVFQKYYQGKTSLLCLVISNKASQFIFNFITLTPSPKSRLNLVKLDDCLFEEAKLH